MKLATLASGSSGNATVIKGGKTTLLVDAGLSGKGIESRLEAIGVNPRELSGIFVTHEHIDHIKGVGVLARKHRLPVYALEPCISAMEVGKLPSGCCQPLSAGQCLEIGDLKLELVETFHDSVASTGLVCYHDETKVGVATDTGQVSPQMVRKLKGCDALVFEANHDETMLWKGRYPYHLKRRIAAPTGHLSNTDAGAALVEIIDENTKRLILAHLSEENNLPELALNSVAQILTDAGVPEVATALKIRTAPRHDPLMVSVG
ncbi:MAG TPA: MBL fold metallo-hydrolase [Desulfobacteria bacterium]|nr:MBL fold metallo-hydrolase [Desulfobacteria bacterium]